MWMALKSIKKIESKSFNEMSKEQATEAKINKWDTSNFKVSSQQNNQNEKATYSMGENIYKPHMIRV